MLLRHGSLPILLLLWLASAQSATLATLYQAQEAVDPTGTGPADLAGLPAVGAPTDAALTDAPAADALAGRPDAGSEATQGSTEAQEALPETGEAQEPLSDSIEAKEPLPETGEVKEPLPGTTEVKEPLPGTAEAQEPLTDSKDTQELQPETAEAQEPLTDPTEAPEPLPETAEAQEPLTDPTEAPEPLPETTEAQEPLPETAEAQEPLPETAEAQEPLPETAETRDPQPDALVPDSDAGTEPIQSETVQSQDPPEQSPPAVADPSDDSDGPVPSLQETLPEEEWGEGLGDTELGTAKEAEDSGGWGLSGLRGGFQTINGYFDSMVELVGGRNGVCQYRCRHGALPQPRPNYQQPQPDGCSSSLIGMQFDMGIPAMTKCCDKLDLCYDTCGSSKSRCDSKFRWCLHSLCSDLKKSLGFVSQVKACESGADALYNTVWTLGCRPYMNSQRAACVCSEEEREEL